MIVLLAVQGAVIQHVQIAQVKAIVQLGVRHVQVKVTAQMDVQDLVCIPVQILAISTAQHVQVKVIVQLGVRHVQVKAIVRELAIRARA